MEKQIDSYVFRKCSLDNEFIEANYGWENDTFVGEKNRSSLFRRCIWMNAKIVEVYTVQRKDLHRNKNHQIKFQIIYGQSLNRLVFYLLASSSKSSIEVSLKILK